MDLVTFSDRLPADGETVVGRQFVTYAGGKGANQAVAVARMGGRSAMVGRVGDDMFGPQLIDLLQSAGVETRRRGSYGRRQFRHCSHQRWRGRAEPHRAGFRGERHLWGYRTGYPCRAFAPRVGAAAATGGIGGFVPQGGGIGNGAGRNGYPGSRPGAPGSSRILPARVGHHAQRNGGGGIGWIPCNQRRCRSVSRG